MMNRFSANCAVFGKFSTAPKFSLKSNESKFLRKLISIYSLLSHIYINRVTSDNGQKGELHLEECAFKTLSALSGDRLVTECFIVPSFLICKN